MSLKIGKKQNVTSIVQVKARGRPDPTLAVRAGEYSHVPTRSGVGGPIAVDSPVSSGVRVQSLQTWLKRSHWLWAT